MLLAAKRTTRKLLCRTLWGFRFYYRRDNHVTGPHGRPTANWYNSVLTLETEIDEAVRQVDRLGLPRVPERSKNWDSLAALDIVLANTSRRACILDAGGEKYSMVLPWLALYGYSCLQSRNLVFSREEERIGPIMYRYGDIVATDFANESVDAITCMSVIEHGVDILAYFREMSRILRPGGVLVTSTDYWENPIDTCGKMAYGVPIRIFTRKEIESALRIAEEAGFELLSPLDLGTQEPAVYWNAYDLRFTFVIFSMRKKCHATRSDGRYLR